MKNLTNRKDILDFLTECRFRPADEVEKMITDRLTVEGAKNVEVSINGMYEPNGVFIKYEDGDSGKVFQVQLSVITSDNYREINLPRPQKERQPEAGVESEVASRILKIVTYRRKNMMAFNQEELSMVLEDIDDLVLKDMENCGKLEVFGSNAIKSKSDESVFSVSFVIQRRMHTLLVRVKTDNEPTTTYLA